MVMFLVVIGSVVWFFCVVLVSYAQFPSTPSGVSVSMADTTYPSTPSGVSVSMADTTYPSTPSGVSVSMADTTYPSTPSSVTISMVQGYLTDSNVHEPPSSGPYLFSPPGSWTPDQPGFLAQGDSYQDPIFGGTIKRLTDNHPTTQNENYAKNGFWNADGTRMAYFGTGSLEIIDGSTGAVVRTGVPGSFDGSFDPIDPDVWYYLSGASLRQYSIASETTSLVRTFGDTLGSLGGSVDWIDKTGRYMVLLIGAVFRVWDKQTDTLLTGSITQDLGTGWMGISPDASWVISFTDSAGQLARAHAIDKVAETVDVTGHIFWTLCGDHADTLSASDGKTYMIAASCFDEAAVWRIDVSLTQSGDTAAERQKQKDDNLRLFDFTFSDDAHFSCTTIGSLQDWCYISTANGGDEVSWWAYKDEIIGINAITSEVRRYAHHRSRNMIEPTGGCYFCFPRIQGTWDGTKVGWASNYGDTDANANEYGDMYIMQVN